MRKEEKCAYDLFFSISYFIKVRIDTSELNMIKDKNLAICVDKVITNVERLREFYDIEEFDDEEEYQFLGDSALISNVKWILTYTSDHNLGYMVNMEENLKNIYSMMNLFARDYLWLTLDECREINWERA